MAPRDFPVKWGEDELVFEDGVRQQHLIQAELDELTEDEVEEESDDGSMQQLVIQLELQTAELLQTLLERFNP